VKEELRGRTMKLCERFPLYPDLRKQVG